MDPLTRPGLLAGETGDPSDEYDFDGGRSRSYRSSISTPSPSPAPSAPSGTGPTSSIFRGWLVVSGVFITLAISSGLGFYNASVILEAAKDELGASVAAVSGATTVFFAIGGVAGFLASPFIDRIDVRWFYLLGGLVGAGALGGLRWVDSTIELYVFFAVFGVGFSLAGLVPGTTVVARWFHVRRSVALSIATTGLSVGGIAVTPLAARLIDDRALAGAGPWMALAWLAVIPLAFGLIRSWPADLGLQPDGAPQPAVGVETAAMAGATFLEARASRFFRLLSFTYAMVFLAQVGALAHLFNLTTERVDKGAAAAALSTLAFASVAGRLLGGVVVTRVPIKPLTGTLIVVQAGALALIAFASSQVGLVLSAAVFGLSVGNLLMMQPLLLAETFGVREYSRIYSYNQLFGTIGVAGGPFVIGYIHDLSDYRTAMLVGSAANVVALAAFIVAGSVTDARATWSAPSLT
jgi:MFS family permease